MKAYLINPFDQTIIEVEHSGDYKEIYDLIQNGGSPFDAVYFGSDRDSIFVDDEGLFKEDQRFFKLEGYNQPLAGRGLVLGCDDEGETVAPKITLSDLKGMILKGMISWVRPDLRLAGYEAIPDGTMADTPLGPMPVIGHTPVFKTGKDDDDGEG
jgi:hypothetical protein